MDALRTYWGCREGRQEQGNGQSREISRHILLAFQQEQSSPNFAIGRAAIAVWLSVEGERDDSTPPAQFPQMGEAGAGTVPNHKEN